MHLFGSSTSFLSGSTATGGAILLGTSDEKEDTEQEEKEDTYSLTERQTYDLLLTVLKLKLLNKEERKLQYAEKIAKIDGLVEEAANDNIDAGWSALTTCLAADSCTDEFYAFMKTVLEAAKIKKTGFFSWNKELSLEPLLHNVLELQQAAENNNIVLRSKLVTDTNALINTNSSLEAKEEWEKLVACDFTCEYDPLLGAIIESYFEKR